MRIFKQVPRILFGEGYLDRLGELLPAKSGGEDYYVYLVDHVHKGTSLESRIQLQPADLLLWVDTSHEPSTALVDGIRDDLQRRRKTNPTAIIGIGGG
ncbi:MAG: alcohol dehydrogenase, partial [Spirochaetia bacterium]|nr:alcohol dehydrogenase [Spirochaetia bacterium]